MFILTGASGFVGKNAVSTLYKTYGSQSVVSSLLYGASSKRICVEDPDFCFDVEPLKSLNASAATNAGGLLHMAFLNRSYINKMGLSAYSAECRFIANHLYQLCESIPRLPIVLISSGASYEDYSPSLAANPYGYLKREEESIFKKLAVDRMVIVFRLFASIGHHDDVPSRFAIGQFIQSAVSCNQVVVKSHLPIYRSFIYLPDLMSLAFNLLRNPLANGFKIIDACAYNHQLIHAAELISNFTNCQVEYAADSTESKSVHSYCGDPTGFLDLYHSRLGHAPTSFPYALKGAIKSSRLKIGRP